MNLADAWEAIAAAIPDADAVVCGERRRSWSELDDRAGRLASGLAAHGIGAGAKIAFYLHNGVEYIEAQYATLKCRAVPCNVNYRYTADELRYLLDNSDAEIVFFDVDLADRVRQVLSDVPTVRAAVQVGGERPEWALAFEDVVGGHDPFEPTERSGDDLWFLYTGGTTGMPKAVMWPHRSLLGTMEVNFRGLRLPVPQSPDEAAAHAREIHRRGKVTRLLTGAPLIHGTAGLTSLTTLTQGGCVVLLPGRSFDADALWRTVETERVTNLVIVGDVFARPMVDALDAAAAAGRPYDLSSVRVVLSSGVMWSAPVKDALLAHRPDLTLVDTLGSSEAVGIGVNVSRGDERPKTARFRLSENARVFTEDGRPVAPGSGERGLLAVGGPLPLGYYKDPEKTAATYRELEGRRWSVAGDWATVEADGTITLLGRGSQCINTGGEKVYPEEVEETLKEHPDVVDCNVVGIPDERWGEAVIAVVELAPGSEVGDDEILGHARQHLSGYKLPKHLVRVPRIERSPNGKTDYRWAREVATGAVVT